MCVGFLSDRLCVSLIIYCSKMVYVWPTLNTVAIIFNGAWTRVAQLIGFGWQWSSVAQKLTSLSFHSQFFGTLKSIGLQLNTVFIVILTADYWSSKLIIFFCFWIIKHLKKCPYSFWTADRTSWDVLSDGPKVQNAKTLSLLLCVWDKEMQQFLQKENFSMFLIGKI